MDTLDRQKSNDGFARVRDYLEGAIQEKAFGPGDQLPTERQLAEDFGVGRAVARRALAELEVEGLISRHVGRGTFVKLEKAAGSADSGIETPVTPTEHAPSSPAEYIEVRLRFEPELIWMVATNGTTSDFEQMQDCLENSEKSKSAEEFEHWDAAFHAAIAAATHNTLAIKMYSMINEVRLEHAMWGTLRQRGQTPEQRLVYQREHREILKALLQRDAEQAHALMTQHIRHTRRRLLDY